MKPPTKALVSAAVQRARLLHSTFDHKKIMERCVKEGWEAALKEVEARREGKEYVGRLILKDGEILYARVVGFVAGHLVVRYPGCMLFIISEAEFKQQWRFLE